MIDPSIQAVLRSPYTIRKFFTIFGMVLAILILLLVLASAGLESGWLRDSAIGFLGNFAASAGIFLVTYAFYVMVTSPGLRNAQVIPLRDVEISNQIVDLPKDASDYWFWGRSGAFFRAEVLPRLCEMARTERKHVYLRIVMPNPSEKNSLRYMRIRAGLNEDADKETLAAQIAATVVSVAHRVSRNPYLKADIGLCASVPVLRFDLSTSGGLLTRDAKHLPAILVNSGNPYFEMLKDAVENELNQATLLTWNEEIIGNKEPEEIVQHLDWISGFPPTTEAARTAAAKLIKTSEHRYGK